MLITFFALSCSKTITKTVIRGLRMLKYTLRFTMWDAIQVRRLFFSRTEGGVDDKALLRENTVLID